MSVTPEHVFHLILNFCVVCSEFALTFCLDGQTSVRDCWCGGGTRLDCTIGAWSVKLMSRGR